MATANISKKGEVLSVILRKDFMEKVMEKLLLKIYENIVWIPARIDYQFIQNIPKYLEKVQKERIVKDFRDYMFALPLKERFEMVRDLLAIPYPMHSPFPFFFA